MADFRVYMGAMHRLNAGVGPVEFDRLYEHATRARLAFEASRDRLRKHCAEHKCELPDGALAASGSE